MLKYINKIKKFIGEKKQSLKHPLYRNSFFIMLTSILNSGLGFVFWSLAAKLYPKDAVGVATALISSASLLTLLSRFGMDYSLIRFFPIKNKSKILSTCIIIATGFALIFGMVFIGGVEIWSPKLQLLKSTKCILYMLFLAITSITSLTGVSFIAMRKAEYNFLQTMTTGSRILFLFPFIYLGTLGIFGAISISFFLACVVALFLLLRLGIKFTFKIDKSFINHSLHFSIGNYIASLFTIAPNMILPIMILNVLGPKETAIYYMVFIIVSLLFMIPNAFSVSLFVEGSHGESPSKIVSKSLFATFSILLPLFIIIYFDGGLILRIIGKGYIEGLPLLRIMISSSFFVAIIYVYYSLKRIEEDIKSIVKISGLVFILLIGLSYIFIVKFGILGIGYSWIISYGIGNIFAGKRIIEVVLQNR